MYVPNKDVQGQLGGIGMGDISYTYYWHVGNTAELGIRTGLSLGYSTAGTQVRLNEQFQNVDYLGYVMDYTVTANRVLQHSEQVQVEVPLMFSVRANGIIFNAGAKVMLPVWNLYKQTMKNLSVDAYYSAVDVHVTDELITGVLSEDKQTLRGRDELPKLNVLVGMELLKEWEVSTNGRIGLGVFADCAVWNNYENSSPSGRIVSVAPIVNVDYPPASVGYTTVNSALVTSMRYWDLGIRLYYAFEWRNAAHYGTHTYHSRGCNCERSTRRR